MRRIKISLNMSAKKSLFRTYQQFLTRVGINCIHDDLLRSWNNVDNVRTVLLRVIGAENVASQNEEFLTFSEEEICHIALYNLKRRGDDWEEE